MKLARLDRRAAQFRQELDVLARNGTNGTEGAIFDARVGQLGQQVLAYERYGHHYGNRYGSDGYGYNGYGNDGW